MAPRPSRSYRLEGGEDAAEGVRRIALGRAGRALERLADAADGETAAAIHGARKDLKKIRAVLRLVRAELGEQAFTTENRRYRDAARLLGQSRDAEVKLETLARLGDRFGEDFPAAAARGWQAALERERDLVAAGDQGEVGERIEAARQAVEAGRDGIRGWSLSTDSWRLVEPGLSRSYRRGRREMKRTLKHPGAKHAHEWRKRAKDLWYQLRIVRDAWPGPLGEAVDQAHELTELLGDHHDLAVLGEDLTGREPVAERRALAALIERRQDELLDAALWLGRRIYAEKPKAFRRRIASYWRIWRQE